VVDPMDKDRSLVRIIEMENPTNALIFCNRKSEVEYLFQFLQNAGYDVDRISGDLSQSAREKVMGLVREHKVRYLIATDVAARGIDIKDLDIVFQYDVPQDLEIYVHRAGRTARAGTSGRCITIVTYRAELPLREIQGKFKTPLQRRELPDLEAVSQRVCERTTVLLEEQLRDAGSVMNERIDRFTPLAEELAQSEEGRRILALLLDDFYHRSLHLPPKLPEEKIRFEEIHDAPGRDRSRDRDRNRDRGERPPRQRTEGRSERQEAGTTDVVAPVPAEGEAREGGDAGARKPRRKRGRGRRPEGAPEGAAPVTTEGGE